MSDGSKIEWTDATWNPVTGCSVVSPGCTNCYAMALAGTRLRNHPSRAGLTIASKAGPVWNGQVRFNDYWLGEPLHWKKPRRVFVCAHGDLFHEDVPDEWIDQVFAVMALAPQHTFQVLTKRAKRMREYCSASRTIRRVYEQACDIAVEHEPKVLLIAPGTTPSFAPEQVARNEVIYLDRWPLANVWLGVSAEDQKRADERVPDLLATPAAVRFVSAEPLLGAIDFARIEVIPDRLDDCGSLKRCGIRLNALKGTSCESGLPYQSLWNGEGEPPTTPPPRLDWIIVGGESGRNARPMQIAWARSIRDQCAGAGVGFFFKQFGEFAPDDNAPGAHTAMRRVGKAIAGRVLDGRTHDAMPSRSA